MQGLLSRCQRDADHAPFAEELAGMLGVAPGLMEAFLETGPVCRAGVGQAVTHGGKGEACLAEAEEDGEPKGDFHGVKVVKGLVGKAQAGKPMLRGEGAVWTMMRDWALVTARSRVSVAVQ